MEEIIGLMVKIFSHKLDKWTTLLKVMNKWFNLLAKWLKVLAKSWIN